VLGRSCGACACGRATRRTGLRASFEGLSTARRCFAIITDQPRREGGGDEREGRSTKTRWYIPCLSPRPIIAHPCPQLRSGANSGFTRVAPTIVVPFPSVYRQMELRNCVLAQYLAECQRKEAIVLGCKPPRSARRRSPQVRCAGWAYMYHRFLDYSGLSVQPRGGAWKMKSGPQLSRQEEGAR
jgi:hypothetical protein